MITRDQKRAQLAYSNVGQVGERHRDDYKIAINDLGTNVLRHGLATALSWLESRRKDDGTRLVFQHLAKAEIPGLGKDDGALASRSRDLPLASYMLATRETLKVVVWHKRAAQSLFGGEG